MSKSIIPHNLIQQAIRLLKHRGVDYADVRFEKLMHESLVAEHSKIKSISLSESSGIGVRVLIRGSWGFAASPHLNSKRILHIVDKAIAIAKSSSSINRKPVCLAQTKPIKAVYKTSLAIDPFQVALSKKLDYLLWAASCLEGPKTIRRAGAHMDFYKRIKLFVSTEGSLIEQQIIESGAGLEIVAQSANEVQSRSYPNSHHGALAQAGYEYVKQLDLVGGAKTIKKEVIDLLSAPSPKAGLTTLVLDPTQVVMQLHESCGHPAELDRALGQELSYAGGSFLTTDRLGKLRYGSEHVNIVADATIPYGAGSFGYDDEGVTAKKTDIVRKGMFVGYLSSRESACRLGIKESSGAMRAQDWSVAPLIRMTNVNLEPGEATLEQLIKDIKHGYLLSTNKSWSIDDKRLNFQFTTEIAREITNGRIGQIIKNPLYTGITPEFWSRCTGTTNKDTWQLWGVSNCAKGEPMQLMHVGHGAPFARFDKVSIAPAR